MIVVERQPHVPSQGLSVLFLAQVDKRDDEAVLTLIMHAWLCDFAEAKTTSWMIEPVGMVKMTDPIKAACRCSG